MPTRTHRDWYPRRPSHYILCAVPQGSKEDPNELEHIHFFFPYLTSNFPVNSLSLEGFAFISLAGNRKNSQKDFHLNSLPNLEFLRSLPVHSALQEQWAYLPVLLFLCTLTYLCTQLLKSSLVYCITQGYPLQGQSHR